MEKITIKKEEEKPEMWKFLVVINDEKSSTKHSVTLTKDYWQKLTGGEHKPEELVRRSFYFLLERESKESILPQFDLQTIQQYFPTFEAKIKISH